MASMGQSNKCCTFDSGWNNVVDRYANINYRYIIRLRNAYELGINKQIQRVVNINYGQAILTNQIGNSEEKTIEY
jgi:hypothetical protein